MTLNLRYTAVLWYQALETHTVALKLFNKAIGQQIETYPGCHAVLVMTSSFPHT